MNTHSAPAPLLASNHPVDWWFVFKFNSGAFPGIQGNAPRTCPFGGQLNDYRYWSQQFVYASSDNPSLQMGKGYAHKTQKCSSSQNGRGGFFMRSIIWTCRTV
ncbi:MAG: hypothetical protein AAGD25_30850 [Cyanobacteria bacterium P01_F01_bin.150]